MTSNCPRRDPPTASRNILFEKSPIVNTDFVWEGRGREGGGRKGGKEGKGGEGRKEGREGRGRRKGG